MDATINALVDLLIKAIPTVIFFVFLTAYLNATYFKPLARILGERRKATEGLRELSQSAFASADRKESEFERMLQAARNQIGQENEETRRGWAVEQTEAIARARAEAEARLGAARKQIAVDLAEASAQVQSNIEPLTERIVQSLTRRRAA